MNNYSFIRLNFKYLFFGFILTFCSSFGQTFFIGIFNPFFREEINLTNTEFGTLYSSATLLSSLILIWAGKLIDETSLRKFTLFVGFSLASTCLFIGILNSIVMLFFGLFFLRLFGQGLMCHISSTSMAKFFNLNRGKALGFSWLGLSLGEGILPGFVIFLLSTFYWKNIWIGISIFLFIIVIPLLLFLIKKERVSDTIFQEKQVQQIKNWKRGEVIRDIKFYFLLPAILAPPFLITGIFLNQSFIFESKDWDMFYLARGFVFYAIFSVISLGIFGILIDKFSARKILPFYLIPMILSFLIVINSNLIFSPILFMIMLSITNGASNVLITSTWSEVYGTKYLGSIRALTVSLMVFSTALAPIIFGYLIDIGMSVNSIFKLMLVYLISSIILLLIKFKSYKPTLIT